MSPRRFDDAYSEHVTLEDGRRVELRLLHEADAELLQRGFTQLSDRSRYQRFCAPKPRLSASELQYLTAVDGEKHFALAAAEQRAGHLEGLGVARFVRLDDRPEVAEPAIVVIDSAQGIGLGNVLMDRLFQAARERSVRTFEFLSLPGNGPVERMLTALPRRAVSPMPDGYTRIDVDEVLKGPDGPFAPASPIA